VSKVVCLWSALTVVFYSLGLSPPGFAENVRLLTLLVLTARGCGDRSYGAVKATEQLLTYLQLPGQSSVGEADSSFTKEPFRCGGDEGASSTACAVPLPLKGTVFACGRGRKNLPPEGEGGSRRRDG
jgi:hypothetical protein